MYVYLYTIASSQSFVKKGRRGYLPHPRGIGMQSDRKRLGDPLNLQIPLIEESAQDDERFSLLISLPAVLSSGAMLNWITPPTTGTVIGFLADVARSKSELIAENTFLMQKVLVLRHGMRPHELEIVRMVRPLTTLHQHDLHLFQPIRQHRKLLLALSATSDTLLRHGQLAGAAPLQNCTGAFRAAGPRQSGYLVPE